MPRSTPSPDKLLGLAISAALSRNEFTSDPGPVIDEVRELGRGRGRDDILDPDVGRWVGFYRIAETAMLCDALLAAFPECEAWVPLGVERRDGLVHGTHDFTRIHDE
ncbi:hypothetical protein [Microbacterium sp. SORGH_AS_0888]|uniref:hypothetical protein n=1 Tax=Microbacterium sp. SORGH_AS_0888 TaxID=3041791 RepID=UPI0027846EE5|nr:hypothetical protein [Microbacterium sp. SORGH_AS_0888]MDQ1130253.1 hypothetical protein [Microbacterium sp. SORGH_AS_0888]